MYMNIVFKKKTEKRRIKIYPYPVNFSIGSYWKWMFMKIPEFFQNKWKNSMYKTLQDDNDARTNIDPNSFCRKLFNVKKIPH